MVFASQSGILFRASFFQIVGTSTIWHWAGSSRLYVKSFSHSNHRDSWTVVTTTNCGVHHGRAVVDATWWWLGFSWQFMWFRQSKPRPAHGVHQSIASVYPTRSYPKQWIRLSKPPLPKGVCLILSYLVPFQLWSFAYIRGSMHMNMVGLHVWL